MTNFYVWYAVKAVVGIREHCWKMLLSKKDAPAPVLNGKNVRSVIAEPTGPARAALGVTIYPWREYAALGVTIYPWQE